MSGLEVDEKPSQWMATFRHAGGEWDRGYIERWALLRHLPSSLLTTIELPTPPLSMDELLQKADTLYVTLPSATVSGIPEMPTELATAVTSGDLPAVNAFFKRRDGWKWLQEEETTAMLVPWQIRRWVLVLQRTTLPTVSLSLPQRSHNRVGKRRGQSIIGVPITQQNDSSSRQVTSLTAALWSPFCRRRQRKNAIPGQPSTICRPQADSASAHSGIDERLSNCLIKLARTTWSWPMLFIPSWACVFSKMAMESVLWSIHANAVLLIESHLKRFQHKQHYRLCSPLFFLMREARVEKQIMMTVTMPICGLSFRR